MRHILRFIGVVMICGVVSPVAVVAATHDVDITPLATTTAPSIDAPSTDQVPAPAEAAAPPGPIQTLASRQFGKPDPAPPTPPHTGIKALARSLGRDIRHLPSMQNLMWVGIGAGAAAAAHPLDDTANARLSGPTLNKVFKPGAVLGQSYTLVPTAVAVYAVGRMSKRPRVSHIGSDLIESLAVSELMTEGLKYTVRRERPDGSTANSFPSGHAAATMAFATTLERHFGWKYYLPAYAFASYVAVSRVHDNRHYLSDVMFGSAVGIIAGRTVTRHGRENFPVQAMAVPGGVAIVYSR